MEFGEGFRKKEGGGFGEGFGSAGVSSRRH